MSEVTPKDDQYLHSCLPVDKDEKILAVYKHHWFAYASVWLIGGAMVVAIMGIALAIIATQTDATGPIAGHKGEIVGAAGLFSVIILLFTSIPVYLKTQERIVLSENSLFQMLQPSLFGSKIDQVGLQHVNDVSVRKDFLGTILGYGHINIETPGEQNNYEFSKLANSHEVAQEIVQAHENFDAALQAGKLPTTYGTTTPITSPPSAQIDPAEYQKFLQYQQMVNAQNAAEQQVNAVPPPPTQQPQTPEQPAPYPPDASSEQPPAGPTQE